MVLTRGKSRESLSGPMDADQIQATLSRRGKEQRLPQTNSSNEQPANATLKDDNSLDKLVQATSWLQTGHKSTVNECFHFSYIEYGYRSTKTIYDTFFTLFTFHNETMNIWSHLLGFICVVFAGTSITMDLFASSHRSALELFAVESYILCAALCLLLSAIYHWFGIVSEECHECLLRLDLTGVGLLVTGSFFPAVYYGFYCVPDIQLTYLIVTGFVLLVGLAAPWLEFKVYGHSVKPFVLASLVVFGLVPFIHWLVITPSVYADKLIGGYLLMFFWYTCGFLVYMSRLPEALFPNSIIATHILPSHTIWHICVLNAVYVWFHFLLTYRELIEAHGCASYKDCTIDNSCEMI